MNVFSCRQICSKAFSCSSMWTLLTVLKSSNTIKKCITQGLAKYTIGPGIGKGSSYLQTSIPSCCRGYTSRPKQGNSPFNRNKTTILYVGAIAVTVLGFSYAAVPLYRLYCQASGLGGTVKQVEVGEKIESMEREENRILKIQFNADTSSSMQWHFKPQQTQVKVAPGETALAFYTATNPTDQPITGISTYNVVPFEAGQYFNKIQCFCFEEQRLNPHEQVDMPVFFYIDPEFTEDPAMIKVDTIILSYTFFEAKEAEKIGL